MAQKKQKSAKPAKTQKNKMTIREARSDADYHRAFPTVRQLLPHLDMHTYADRVFVARATGYRMFIGEVNKEVVGVVGIIANHNLHDGYVTYIEHVVVDEDHRDMGYGKMLLAFAEKRAAEEGCRLVDLDVDVGREDVEKFYTYNNYRRVGTYFSKKLANYTEK